MNISRHRVSAILPLVGMGCVLACCLAEAAEISAGKRGASQCPAENLVKHKANPVLDVGRPGAWDEGRCGCFTVARVGKEFCLWYMGCGGRNSWRIGLATSADGVTWKRSAANPVLPQGDPGRWDDRQVSMPFVLQEGDTLRMWYTGSSQRDGGFGLATSADGVHWTRHGDGPVLRGTGGSYDPFVLKLGNQWILWYCGTLDGKYRILRATSDDGIRWTKQDKPVLPLGSPGQFDSQSHAGPCVLQAGGTWVMFYLGNGGKKWTVGLATSADGIEWKKSSANPVLDVGGENDWDGGSILGVEALWLDGRLHVWYAAHPLADAGKEEHEQTIRIGYATGAEPTIARAAMGAAEYFVSNAGDDANSGADPSRPWRTIGKVNGFGFAPGDVIRFQRSGVWREQLDPRSGSDKGCITYAAYGEGPKPLLLGSVEKNRPSDWQQAGPSLWRTGPFPCDVGNVIFNNGKLCGIKVWRELDVNAPHKFWYDLKQRTVLLYAQRHPAESYEDIECALTRHIISQGGRSCVVYDGLHLAYGSCHGIGGGGTHHVVVRNCDLCFIGGGHQHTTPSGHHVRFGNGIEFWDGAHDNLVEHCRIWDVYDAGLTNQGGSKNAQHNITYRKNVIWNCEYSFEYWNRPETSTTHDVYFEDNLCFNAGHGWSHAQRPWPAGVHLMFFSNSAQTRRFFVRRNVFHVAKHSTINLDAKHWNGLEELTFDENLYCQPGDTLLVGWSAATYKPGAFGDYQRRTQKDARSVLATVKSIAASPASIELRVGDARPMKVTATYSNGAAVDVTSVCSLKSSDPAVALPDPDGLVRARKPGRAGITAAFEAVATAASIVVKP